MFGELAQLAVGNLSRARARLAMTAGGVLVGTTAVVLLIAMTIGLQQAAESGIGSSSSLTEINVYPNFGFRMISAGEVVSEQSESPQLDLAAIRRFWQIEGVAAVIPMVNLQAGGEIRVGEYSNWAQIAGIDPALLPYLGITIERGEMSLLPGQALVGKLVSTFYIPSEDFESVEIIEMDLLSEEVELRLFSYASPTPTEREVDLNVVGQIREGSSFDFYMLMPLEDVVRWNEWNSGQKTDWDEFRFDQVIVRAASRDDVMAVTEAIRDMGYQAGGMGDYVSQLNNFFTTMRLMLGGIGGVALLVAAFGVANTMTMAILERTKEIGLMKAIGATDRDILTVFLIEAGLVGLSGGLAGVGTSYFLQNVINQALANAPSGEGGGMIFLPLDPSQIGGNLVIIPSELALFAIALATLVGLAAGFYPALRAAHLPPVFALKQE